MHPDDYVSEDHLDELHFMALDSPRSMVEIYRTDLLALIEMAQELIQIKSKENEQ